MTTSPEALLYTVLERCSRTPHGYVIDPDDRVIRFLISEGFLRPIEDGQAAVTTSKGMQLLKKLGHIPRRGTYPYN